MTTRKKSGAPAADASVPATTPEAVDAQVLPPVAGEPEAGSASTSKTFWMGVGIGSTALVAALMYARRPKKGRRA